MTYDVRRAPRAQLIAELEQFAQDRERVGKQDRADAARAAAAKLAEGDERVQFEYTLYAADDEPGRNGVRSGTREWILNELDEAGKGWTHFGNRALAIAHAAAITEIEQGADRVQVGHIEYQVVESP
jgi:hypothetical protein